MKRLPFIIALLSLIPVGARPQTFPPLVNAESFCIQTGTRQNYQPDTLAAASQLHHPLYATKTDSWTELGNNGLPAIPNHYRPITHSLQPLMFQGYASYNTNPGQLTFLNVNKPFSLVNYNSGGNSDKNGQTINALFGKNLKNNGNLTLTARYVNSNGHFQNQMSIHSSIRADYRLARQYYSLYVGASRSGFKSGENGGIRNDSELAGLSSAPYLPVNLDKASSKANIWSVNGLQIYDFRRQVPPQPDSLPGEPPDSIHPAIKSGNRILHRFALSDINRHYNDPTPLRGFYPNVFLDSVQTADSVRFTALRNEILFQTDSLRLLGQTFTAEAGITPDLFRYAFADTARLGGNLGLAGNLRWTGDRSKFGLSANAVMLGYAAGDFGLLANYTHHSPSIPESPVIAATFGLQGITPDPLTKHYLSNHFRWDQDFSRQLEGRITLNYDLPIYRLANRVEMTVNRGWIYFGPSGIPQQVDGWNGVFSLSSSKKFRWGPLHTELRGTAQYSTGKEIPLPLLTAGTNTYMHHDIHFKKTGGLLELEYGFDARFTSSFKGYGFLPATGVFFVQDLVSVGNYPYLDLFALIKVKRTRIFVQWCHTLAGILSETSFGAVHYPFMRPHLKYGIYWHFYD
ncbi:MAG: putative porin [Bacteroidales bacterium]